jgi:hypothetical protein
MEKLVARLQSIVDAQGGDEQDPPVANADQEVEEPVAEPSPAFEAQGTAAPVHQTAAQTLPVYQPVVLPSGNPVAFYEMSSNRRIEEYLRLVIDGEGPLPEALLFQRVARAWNLGRTGARIVERLRGLVPSDIPRTEEDEHTFYWPTGIDPTTYRTFRVADETDDSKRHVADVAVEEIAALVRHVLESAGSTSRPDLAKAVCRVAGMSRTPADAESRVAAVINAMIRRGTLTVVEGYVRST